MLHPLGQAQQIQNGHAHGQKDQGQQGLQGPVLQYPAHVTENPGQGLHAEKHENMGAGQQKRGLLDPAGQERGQQGQAERQVQRDAQTRGHAAAGMGVFKDSGQEAEGDEPDEDEGQPEQDKGSDPVPGVLGDRGILRGEKGLHVREPVRQFLGDIRAGRRQELEIRAVQKLGLPDQGQLGLEGGDPFLDPDLDGVHRSLDFVDLGLCGLEVLPDIGRTLRMANTS